MGTEFLGKETWEVLTLTGFLCFSSLSLTEALLPLLFRLRRTDGGEALGDAGEQLSGLEQQPGQGAADRTPGEGAADRTSGQEQLAVPSAEWLSERPGAAGPRGERPRSAIAPAPYLCPKHQRTDLAPEART